MPSTISRHAFGLLPRAGLCGLGFCPFLGYAMKSRQQATACASPAKRWGPKPSGSDETLLGPSRTTWRHRPRRARDIRKVWARLPVLVASVFPQAGAPGDARENLALAPIAAAAVAEMNVGEIITQAPNLMWGTEVVQVFTVDDGWGWVLARRHRALERRVRRLACVQARRPLRRPSADLHGACEAVCLDLRGWRKRRPMQKRPRP